MVSPISRISVEDFDVEVEVEVVEVEVEKKSKRSKIDSRGENQESGMVKHMFGDVLEMFWRRGGNQYICIFFVIK